MSDTRIIEASDNLNGDPVVTVKTWRGEEMSFNAYELSKAFADLVSDLKNERRHGWSVEGGWFEGQIYGVSARAKVGG